MTNPIVDNEFYTIMSKARSGATNRMHGYRWGQSLFNATHLVRPDLADQVRGTLLDPFYDDAKADAFIEFLAEKCDEIAGPCWQCEAGYTHPAHP